MQHRHLVILLMALKRENFSDYTPIQSNRFQWRNSLCHSLSRWLRLSGLRPARKISQRCSIAAPALNFTCLFYFLQCLGTHPRGIIPEFALWISHSYPSKRDMITTPCANVPQGILFEIPC